MFRLEFLKSKEFIGTDVAPSTVDRMQAAINSPAPSTVDRMQAAINSPKTRTP